MKTWLALTFLFGATFAQDLWCLDVEDGARFRAETCSSFYECNGGARVRHECEFELYFNEATGLCDDPENVDCESDTPTQDPPTVPNTLVSCEGLDDFSYIPHPDSCSEYFQCSNNFPYLLSCPRGLYFSPERNTCIEEYCRGTEPPPPVTPPPQNVTCEGVQDFEFIPSMESCTEYYQCINNTPFRLACPRGLYFDVRTRTCTYSNIAECALYPPSVPPPVETSCVGRDNFSFIPSQVSCVEYYQCIDDVAFRMQCPRGLYFSPDQSRCMYQNEANCVIRVPPTLPPPVTVTPPSTPNPESPAVSCNGVTNFNFIASPFFCGNYYQCIDGNAFLLSCPSNRHFNEERQTCLTPEDANCVVQRNDLVSCDGVDNGWFLRHPTSCSTYFQCINGNPVMVACPRGLYFDERIQSCNYPFFVDCSYTLPTDEPPASTVPSEPSCLDRPDFTQIAHESQCALYYVCIAGTGFLNSCPIDSNFDEVIGRCNNQQFVNCGDRVTRVTTTTSAPWIDPQCVGRPNGTLVANEFDCSQYYQCIDNRAHPRYCEDNLWFDEGSQNCRPQDEVNCPVATTIPPQTTTDTSPAGLCREARNGTYVRNMMSCGEFFVCLDGEPHGRVCQEGLWFSLNQQRCTSVNDAHCELDAILCNGVEGELSVRAPSSCSDFISCENGFPYPARCWGDYWFNEETGLCGPRDQAQCDLDVPPPPLRGPCDRVGDFRLAANPENCGEFFVCYDNEILLTQQCDDGTVFDDVTQVCGGEFDCWL